MAIVMKSIGIVSTCFGGTSTFLNQLLQHSNTSYFPELFMHQAPLEKYISLLKHVDILGLSNLVLESIKKMDSDFVVIPNNTLHMAIEYITEKSPIPIINLLEAISKACIEKGFSKVLVLGTSMLINSRVIQDKLESYNIQSGILPNISEQITDEIIAATISKSSSFSFSNSVCSAINEATPRYDSVVLACSDLVKEFHHRLAIPTLDPMEALAKAAMLAIL